MLAHEAVVKQIEGELEHALGSGGLAVDFAGDLDGLVFELRVVGDDIDGAHAVHILGGVAAAEEEDLPRELLADLLGQVGGAVPAVEGADIGVGLLEAGFLAGCDGHVTHDVEGVTAAGGPAVDHSNDHLRHRANEALDLQDVQAAALSLHAGFIDMVRGGSFHITVVAGGVLVAGTPANALVATGAERPTAVLRGGAITGEQHNAHGRIAARVIERPVQLIHRVRAESIAHLRPIKGNAHDAICAALASVAVVGDVSEVKALDGLPLGRVEGLSGGISSGVGHSVIVPLSVFGRGRDICPFTGSAFE